MPSQDEQSLIHTVFNCLLNK